MRVLKSKFVRVFLFVVLVLSFSFTSVFAASSFVIAEPAASPTQGYCVIETSNGSQYCYFWNTSLYGASSGDNDNNDCVVVDIRTTANTVTFTFRPMGSYLYYDYNLSYVYGDGSALVVLSSSQSAGSYSVSDSFSSGTIEKIYFTGNVGSVSTHKTLKAASCNFGDNFEYYSQLQAILAELDSNTYYVNLAVNELDAIYRLLNTFPEQFSDIIDLLTSVDTDTSTIISILNQWANTSLDESTSPLPNQGLNDFESSQGSLRNDSDVSSSLDNVFNDVDFGGFSNGFTAVWGLVDGVLNSHPIFFTLVILVLSLGLLNLIFNRR